MMSAPIPFVRELTFAYGVPDQVSPLIRRVIARNPSPFTFHGTGTYIVGHGGVAIIDPGPLLAEHIDALLDAVAGETVTHLVITHTHRDHSPAARLLKDATRAPTYGFGPHGSGRPEPGAEVEEGADHDFVPDVAMRGGERIEGDGWTLEAVHTPGHTSNHLCYRLVEEAALFTGDHIMGWSTSVISPPDGDMQAYMASLWRCLDRDERIFWPTHGPPVTEPEALVAAFIAHREAREAAIADCLASGIGAIPDMVATIYTDTPRTLHAAAGRSVLAHLVHMIETGRAEADGPPGLGAGYRPTTSASAETLGKT